VTTVGIVSPGAMGSAVGRVLGDAGCRVVATVEGRSERTEHLAAALEPLPTLDDVVAASEIVLSIVPPGVAVEVAGAIAAAAHRQGVRPLVADLNATAPTTMEEVSARLRHAGLEVVDGSISGPPPTGAGTTIIYLSGGEAARVASLEAPGLELRVVGGAVGTASAIKMSTASFYKGQAAIFAQALCAAEANGVLEIVLEDLGRHYPELIEGAPRLLQSVAAKSGRFVDEMHEIAAAQEQVGLTPELFSAIATVYLELSRSEAGSRSPEQADPEAHLQDVLRALEPATAAGGDRAGGAVTRRNR
jgi:3-hydroxyisobutyrate dehydrogenase-like beta-hydroxyacid dehydrogenase